MSDIVEAPTSRATPKEEHELLYGIIKDFHDSIIDFEFKHGVILSVILGWIITSDKARDFISKSPIAYICIIIVMILLTTFHFIWVRVYSSRSKSAREAIRELDYMPVEFADLRIVSEFSARTFIVIHALVTTAICLMVVVVHLQGP